MTTFAQPVPRRTFPANFPRRPAPSVRPSYALARRAAARIAMRHPVTAVAVGVLATLVPGALNLATSPSTEPQTGWIDGYSLAAGSGLGPEYTFTQRRAPRQYELDDHDAGAGYNPANPLKWPPAAGVYTGVQHYYYQTFEPDPDGPSAYKRNGLFYKPQGVSSTGEWAPDVPGAPGTVYPIPVIPAKTSPGRYNRPGDEPLPRTYRRPRRNQSSIRDLVIDVAPGTHSGTNIGFVPPPGKPPGGTRERKLRASSRAYRVMRRAADVAGEGIEFIDILAESAGYSRNWVSPRGFTGINKKLEWLFLEGGIENVDWEELDFNLRWNTAEDAAYGQLGRLGAAAAEELGLFLGPQTGLAM